MNELGLSEDAALRRLNASRLAAKRPQVFDAIADQRLTLSSALLLSPYVMAAPIEELITGLAHKSLTPAREWLAARFPQSAIPTQVEFVHADGSRTSADLGATSSTNDAASMGQVALARPALSESSESVQSTGPLPRSRTIPLNAEQVAYQFTVDRATHELLLRAQQLLGAEVTAGDVATVFALALKSLVIVPLAQGGRTTVDNLRLLCAAHNQYEADRKLGRTFMEQKRANTPPLVNHERKPHDFDFEGASDVKAALYTLGYRKDEITNAMEFAAGLPAQLTAPERVKAILRQRHVKVAEQSRPAATP